MEDLRSNIKYMMPGALVLLLVFISRYGYFMSLINKDSLPLMVALIPLVFVAGFLVSSISYFIIGASGLRYPRLSYEVEKEFKARFNLRSVVFHKTVEGEIADWIIQDKNISKEIAEKIDNRWNMAIANLSCCVALVMTLLPLYFLKIINVYDWLTVCSLVFAVIFFTNFLLAYNDVNGMTNFVIKLNKSNLTANGRASI